MNRLQTGHPGMSASGKQGCVAACLPLQLATQKHSILNLQISILGIYDKRIEFILKHYIKSTLDVKYFDSFLFFYNYF